MNQDFNEEVYPSIKTFLFCGEVLLNDTARQLSKRFPRAEIFKILVPRLRLHETGDVFNKAEKD